jgi:hypothetical protein
VLALPMRETSEKPKYNRLRLMVRVVINAKARYKDLYGSVDKDLASLIYRLQLLDGAL